MKKLYQTILSLNIATKISLTIVGLTLFLILSVLYINLISIQAQSKKLITEFTHMIIHSNQSHVVKTLLADDAWGMYKLVKSMSSNDIIQEAGFIDKNGFVFAHTNTQQFPRKTLYVEEESTDLLYIPLQTQEDSLGFFVLRVEDQHILDLLKQTLYLHFPFLLLAMLFSLAIGAIITSRILSRLSLLTINAKAIQEERFDDIHPIDLKENDEITKLVNSLTFLMQSQQQSLLKEEHQKEFYHSILASLDAFVLICDQNFRPIYHNEHPLKNNLLTLKNKELFLSETFISKISLCLARKKEDSSECSWEMSLGEHQKQSLLVHSRALKDQFVMIISETTKVKELEEHYQLSRSFTLIGEISASFAHQIKNLLLPMKLLIQPKNTLTHEDQEMLHSLLGKMDGIVGNFLSIGQNIDTKLDSAFVCEELVSKVTFMLAAHLEHKNITLHLEMAKEPLIMMDPSVFERVVTDLLSNAIDAAPQESTISFFWERYDETFGMLSIQDQGEGITDDVKEHIFDPFFTTKKGGNGLGLFHVYRSVYLYKGRIELTSRPGLTRFSLLLPTKESK